MLVMAWGEDSARPGNWSQLVLLHMAAHMMVTGFQEGGSQEPVFHEEGSRFFQFS